MSLNVLILAEFSICKGNKFQNLILCYIVVVWNLDFVNKKGIVFILTNSSWSSLWALAINDFIIELRSDRVIQIVIKLFDSKKLKTWLKINKVLHLNTKL